MADLDSHETPNSYPNLSKVPLNAVPLSNQQQVRPSKINEIKDYFVA